MRNRHVASVVLVGLLLSGCKREATGQVAAVVNGQEITLQEVNAEVASVAIPPGEDKKAVQQAALQKIIDRKLMAQAARNDDLDKTSDYLLRESQLREALLGQLLTQKIQRTVEIPDQKTIDDYIAKNPELFAEHKIYTLDRILLAPTLSDAQLKEIKDDHSMDAVAASLNKFGIQFQRNVVQADAVQIGVARLKQILNAPSGEPFAILTPNILSISVITGERLSPVTGEAARPFAVKAIQSQELQDRLNEQLKNERAQAKIEYQPGFAPKTGGAAPSAKN